MHKFSTVAPKPSALTALHSVGLLNVLQGVRLRRPPVARLVRPAFSTPRYENLCISRAYPPSWIILILLALPLMVLARGQQPEEGRQELSNFLPDDEAKALVSESCMRCHSATRIRQAITQRMGGDERFWSTLVGQMVTVWNAPIVEEDVASIVAYLSKHFGPSSRPPDRDRPSPLQASPDEELNTFLPDDEGKVLLTVYCRNCHSATQIRQNLTQRAGGNEAYWYALVQRMMTVWNAPIAEEEAASIVTYLSRHFGPSWAR